MGAVLGFVIGVIYIAILVYLVTLMTRFVTAMERISQNVEVGVIAWTKDRQQSGD